MFTGCDLLLKGLQSNSSLRILNLSSCCLSNRSATYLSLYLRKRKSDLLQSAWNEFTLSRDELRRAVVCIERKAIIKTILFLLIQYPTLCITSQKEGLQVLILDRNCKFSDIGLRHLIRVLKTDFWLKKLCLRFCGITDREGQIILELLRTNKVILQIDLRENEVPANVLQIICKLLKRRKIKLERISMQKRLLHYHKHFRTQEMISKSTSSPFTLKNKYSNNQYVSSN